MREGEGACACVAVCEVVDGVDMEPASRLGLSLYACARVWQGAACVAAQVLLGALCALRDCLGEQGEAHPQRP